jgi:hypothetical protein
MLFMVVESFKDHDVKAIYRRLKERGRSLPDGLIYVGSWVEASCGRCFQLMETNDVTLFQRWVAEWQDLLSLEIIPVVPGKDAADAIYPLLDTSAR